MFIPAAHAAVTPLGASSNTRMCADDFGSTENLSLANKNISGAGLGSLSSGSSEVTTCEVNWKRSLWFAILRAYPPAEDPVATAKGILCLWRWCTSFSTPKHKKNNPTFKVRHSIKGRHFMNFIRYSLSQAMLKLTQNVRGYFAMLIEVGIHLIIWYPELICKIAN